MRGLESKPPANKPDTKGMLILSHMSLTDKTKVIREELKKIGITSRQVSVKGRNCGYSDAIDVKIKDVKISDELVDKIARKFYSVDRDERSGEILEGGNTYMHVDYDYESVKAAAVDYMEVAQKWIDDHKADANECGRDVAEVDDIRIVFWNHHPTQPWYPIIEVKKKRIANYEGKTWETSDRVETCKAASAEALAGTLAVWNHKYNLNLI